MFLFLFFCYGKSQYSFKPFAEELDSAVFEKGFAVQVFYQGDSVSYMTPFFFADTLPRITCDDSPYELVNKGANLLRMALCANNWSAHINNNQVDLSLNSLDTLYNHNCGEWDKIVYPVLIIHEGNEWKGEFKDIENEFVRREPFINYDNKVLFNIKSNQVLRVVHPVIIVPLVVDN